MTKGSKLPVGSGHPGPTTWMRLAARGYRGQALPQVISLFTSRHPDCNVHVAETGIEDPTAQLRRGEFDLIALDLRSTSLISSSGRYCAATIG